MIAAGDAGAWLPHDREPRHERPTALHKPHEMDSRRQARGALQRDGVRTNAQDVDGPRFHDPSRHVDQLQTGGGEPREA